MAEWTDETLYPWGTDQGLQGKPLHSVPARHLLWLMEQDWIHKFPEAVAYLKKNEDVIRQELKEQEESMGHVEPDSFEDYLQGFRGF